MIAISLSSTASCLNIGSTKLEIETTSENDLLMNMKLASGTEVGGIRYKQERLSKKWILQIKSSSGTTIDSVNKDFEGLSVKEFQTLFTKLVTFIKDKNNGQLDKIQLGLGTINDVWKDTQKFILSDAVAKNHKLKSKDLYLAKLVSSHLMKNLVVNEICAEVVNIQKSCKNKFVSMNPISFKDEHSGKELSQVTTLPDLGISIDKIWFGLNLNNK